MAVGERGVAEPDGRERARRRLLRHSLVDEVVGRVLEEQRHPPRALDLPARRSHQSGGVPQQRRLAGAVPAHQRDALAGDDRKRYATENGRPAVDLVPDPVELERWFFGAPARLAIPLHRGAGRERIGVREQPPRPQGRAGRLHARHRRQSQAGQEPRARRRQFRRRVAGPGEELGRAGVADHAPAAHRDRSVGEAQAPLEPVLGDHDRGVEVLVEAPEQRDQLVAGDGVELRGRLVEQDQLRPARERRAERDALELAAGQLGGRAVEQVRDPERERRLLDRARHRGGRLPLVLERERQLGADGAHHHLRLGILEQRADGGGQRAWTVLARVHPGDASRGRRTPHHGNGARAHSPRAAASTSPSPTRRPARPARPGRCRA